MFWLATLNPGRKSHRKRRHKRGCACVICAHKSRKHGRRRSGKRRRLTDWQRMVKKYGGVRQAVKARRKLKRRGRRFAANAVSTKKRGRRSRRRNGSIARRSDMARTRRRRSRRLPPRGAHGRFKSRRSKGRRRVRRNPLFRARRTGKYSRRGSRRLHQYRPGGIGWHNPRRRKSGRRRSYRRNAVMPISWNGRRHRRRSYRRNAVVPTSWNPAGALAGVLGRSGPLSRVQGLVDIKFWTETGLPAVGGFLCSKVVGGMVFGLVGEKLLGVSATDKSAPYVRAGADAIAGGILSWAAESFMKNKKMADAIWLGTVISVGHTILKALIGDTDFGRSIGLSGLGDDVSSALRDRVKQRVERSLSNYGTYLTQEDTQPQLNEFVTEDRMRLQSSYAPGPNGDLRDYDVARTETAL